MSGQPFRGRPSQATIDSVALPAKIKCIDCNKNLMATRYSNNQLKKYQESIYKKGEFNAQRPRCLLCTGTPGDELVCAGCGDSKSLEQFSKNARKKDRDNAHCWDCQQRVSDQEPILKDAMEESKIEEDYHTKGASVFNLGGMGSSLPSASKKSSHSTPSEAGTDSTGKVWITQPLSTGGRATASRGRTQPNASNENSRHRSNSQDSVATTDTKTTTSTVTSNCTWNAIGNEDIAQSRVARSSTSQVTDKWHKQGAVKKTATEKVRAAVERSTRGPENQQRLKDDDDDSDSDFEM